MQLIERPSLYDEFKKDPARRRHLLEEDLLNDVTEKICEVLELRGISRADLARSLGKTKGYVTQILRGQNLTLRSLASVADALGCIADVEFLPSTEHALTVRSGVHRWDKPTPRAGVVTFEVVDNLSESQGSNNAKQEVALAS